jgi:hypothetical protein
MIETPSTREIAEFFKMLLTANWIDKPAIIAWADSVLVSQAEPDPALIDLSTSANHPMHEMFSALEQVRGAFRPGIPMQMFIAYLGTEYVAGRKKAVEIVTRLSFEFDYRIVPDLPDEIGRAVGDCKYLIDPPWDLSTGKSIEELKEERKRQLDQKLREVLEWGRPYRDVLPAQCFPPDSAP